MKTEPIWIYPDKDGKFPMPVPIADYETHITQASHSNNCHDGKIDLIFTGGHPPFDVQWTGPQGFTYSINGVNGDNLGEDIYNLAAGNYRLFSSDGLCGTKEEILVVGCNK